MRGFWWAGVCLSIYLGAELGVNHEDLTSSFSTTCDGILYCDAMIHG